MNGLELIQRLEVEDLEKKVGDINDVIKKFEDLSHIAKEEIISDLISLGNSYIKMEKYSKAEFSFKRILDLEINNIEGWNGLGNVYLKQNSFENAKDCYQKSIEIDPDYEIGWRHLAEVSILSENFEEAELYCIKAEDVARNKLSFIDLGEKYFRIKKFEDAEHCFKVAIELDRDFPDSWNGLGVIYNTLNEYKRAILCFKKAIRLDPKNPKYRVNLKIVKRKK